MRRGTRRLLWFFAGSFFSLLIFTLFAIDSAIETIDDRVKLSHGTDESILYQSNDLHSLNPQVDQGQRRTQTQVQQYITERLRYELNKLSPNEIGGCNHSETLAQFEASQGRSPLIEDSVWEKFYNEFGKCDVYRENSRTVEQLLKEMNELEIIHASVQDGGTQIKLILTFANGKRAIFKPQRFPDLNQETLPNHFYFSDYERSFSEIAAFHLDKLLGFRRSMPTVGRILSLQQIWNISDEGLKPTFFVSPSKNTCFSGKCFWYCDVSHAICGTPDKIRGSVQVYLPSEQYVLRNHVNTLYYRTYSQINQLAAFQKTHDFCNLFVKKHVLYKNGRGLLDLVDVHILDFLIGNLDRHHVDRLNIFDQNIYTLHLDNGKGFGSASKDYHDILAPLYQCCIIRATTLSTLLDFYSSPVSFGKVFEATLTSDPTFPILADNHYAALDRRLEIVLQHVVKCITKANNVHEVIRSSFKNHQSGKAPSMGFP